MGKYSVNVKFKNGREEQFETVSNIAKIKPQVINGSRFIVTEDQHMLNIDQIDKMDVQIIE